MIDSNAHHHSFCTHLADVANEYNAAGTRQENINQRMSETTIIVGAGHAAGQTAISLRHDGYAGKIVIVGEENYPPYQRPPLSKKFLSGELPLERLFLRKQKFYAEHDVELRLNTRVEEIDRAGQRVRCDDGTTIDYTRVVIATGSHARELNMPGVGLDGVYYLRTIDDVLGMQERFQAGASIVIIGAGYIGLEVAAVAATAGLKVTVIEMADRVLARVVAPEVSEFFERVHREAGVDIRTGCRPGGELVGDGEVRAAKTADGETIPAELILVGIGIEPTVELAAAAGLACDNGIVVDEFCCTADPLVLAVGDCTNHPNGLLGRRLRLESVHNAQEQAKTAAATICGTPKPYSQIPWFWSDQYDLKLQIVGLSGNHDRVVIRGEPEDRSFAAFYMHGDLITAVDAVNSPREFMLSKKLLACGARIEPDILSDTEIPFKDLAEAALS
jgi:3-phenylpropionate/trans-cinnamate dioxygenase ferredoxin reductase subunit